MLVRAIPRVLLGMAIGSAAAVWLTTRQWRRSAAPAPGASAHREWYSDYPPGADGRLGDDALADGASEDSFPASDPPARMGSLVLGAPHRQGDRDSGAPARSGVEPARLA